MTCSVTATRQTYVIAPTLNDALALRLAKPQIQLDLGMPTRRTLHFYLPRYQTYLHLCTLVLKKG